VGGIAAPALKEPSISFSAAAALAPNSRSPVGIIFAWQVSLVQYCTIVILAMMLIQYINSKN
jgi:hypothetical protein